MCDSVIRDTKKFGPLHNNQFDANMEREGPC